MLSRSNSQICVLVGLFLGVVIIPLNTAGSPLFDTRIDYAVGMDPRSVAIGDLNGDGHPDLVVANFGSPFGPPWVPGTVSVLLGKGDGTFQTPVNYETGWASESVAIGDLNGDGYPDLAVANVYSYTVSVLLGNGDGTFQTAVDYVVGFYPFSVAIGDLNGDGHLDLAVANEVSNTVSVLLGNGDGTFQTAVNYEVGTFPQSVAIGDLDGDGNPDLAVVDGSGVSVLLGNGDGTFQVAVNYGVVTNPVEVAIGDLNGDGYPDLAVADSAAYGGTSSVSVLLGNGDGTFQTAVDYRVGSAPSSVAIRDLNGDGHPDLAVTNSGDDTVSVLLGNGDGTFKTAVNYGVGYIPAQVAIGDLNGDGHPDLAVANQGMDQGTVSVVLGNGDGTFPTAVNYGVGSWPVSVAIGDLNGDGHPDLAVTDSAVFGGASKVSVLMGNGDGTFKTAVNYGSGTTPVFVAIGDLNGDGHPDLAVTNAALFSGTSSVSVLMGNGDGTFQTAVNYGVGSNPIEVAIGDLNGDGHPDMAVANSAVYAGTSSVSVLLGNGDGTFQAAVDYGVGITPSAVAIGDLNGDGNPDLAVTNSAFLVGGTSTISVLLGNGDGTFQVAVNYGVGSTPATVAIGDLNGDGNPDLAVANSAYSGGTSSVSVLLGNGDGSFQPAVNYRAGSNPVTVAIGDLNGDGNPDLAVTNMFGNDVSVLLGNGDGTFQAAVNYGVGGIPMTLAIGDLNGDGRPDLAVTNTGSKNVSILINVPPCTTPPGAPNLSNPANGATNVSIAPVLKWAPVSGVTSYDVEVCSDSACSSVVRSKNVTAAQWTVSPALIKTMSYWWHVQAKNLCGSGPWSDTWSFTTGNCFIATAAYGTAMQGKIDVLRSFRDSYLTKTTTGEAVVETYYSYSPPVADYIAHRAWLRAVVRILLSPVIGFISLFV